MRSRVAAAGLIACLLGIALQTPARAVAHDIATSRGHEAEDAVTHTPEQERRLERRTGRATRADARASARSVTEDPGVVGSWGAVVDWPVVAVNVALLTNGKVLAYDSVGDKNVATYDDQSFTRATVWNPADGRQAPANVVTGVNIFCSGLTHLFDGSVFAVGGNQNSDPHGITATHSFNSKTNTWTRGPEMSEGRWYPSVTALPNSEALITDGTDGIADVPEVRRTNGTLRRLGGAALDLPLYPWMDVAPNGEVFNTGPDPTIRSLDVAGRGSWTTFGARDQETRDYGGRALFDVGKLLVAGGGGSSDTADVIDLNGPTPEVSPTSRMQTGRRQFNLTVLADGTVLATGGNSSGAGLVDLDHGVYSAELWTPDTGKWQTLSSMRVTRQYHSTALLLPDGRILSAGGGVCQRCDEVGYLAKNAEVFSPPYLFRHDGSGDLAPRPQINEAPASIGYDKAFRIELSDPASISKMALVRLGAVTHSNNMEQRYVPLRFSEQQRHLVATAPASLSVAPPGFYMLFAVDSHGVPSVAKMIQVAVDPPAPPHISGTTPRSPAHMRHPRVRGSLAPKHSTVSIHAAAGCKGPVRGIGSGRAFDGSRGIKITVQRDHRSSLSASFHGADSIESRCSRAFAYAERSSHK